jgi:hypothetical protein
MVGFEPTVFTTRVRNFKFRVFQPLHHMPLTYIVLLAELANLYFDYKGQEIRR